MMIRRRIHFICSAFYINESQNPKNNKNKLSLLINNIENGESVYIIFMRENYFPVSV